MDRRTLGASPVEVTTLSFGGAAIGGLFAPVSGADATGGVVRWVDLTASGCGGTARRIYGLS